MEKMGLVLEGGSFRGIFTAGVLDYLLEQNISFPYIVGVSAGSGNAANFIAGQAGRTQKVITHENADPYYGMGQIRKNGKFLNLDTMLYDYSYEQIPFDFKTFFESDVKCEFVVANCNTGKAEYMNPKESNDEERLLEICKATCSVPMICSPVMIDNTPYLDGSIIDSIPVMRALEHCEKAIVILTRKDGEKPTDYSRMKSIVKLMYRDYPGILSAMMERFEVYDKQMQEVLELEKSGKIFIIRPEMESIGHFEKKVDKINAFYKHGYEIMKANLGAMKAFMENE